MGKAVSIELRLRMVRGIAAGKSRRCVAAQFEVSPSTDVAMVSCGRDFGALQVRGRESEGFGLRGASQPYFDGSANALESDIQILGL